MIQPWGEKMVGRIRARPWGLAVCALEGDETSFSFDAGDDPVDESSLFQVGSVTKTMTGVLLADAIGRGETTADARLGDLLDFEGGAADVTLLQLATQRSGLPRLPPNLDPTKLNPKDPYAKYTAEELQSALAAVEPGPPDYEYSNFGFMTLGLALTTAAGQPMDQLLRQRIFEPLAMKSAGCPPPDSGRMTGYAGADPTPWWSTQLPGAGGVGASITDLAHYLRAHIDLPPGPLGQAIEMATTIHAEAPSAIGFGWGHQGGGWFHDGATGGFASFVAIHRPTRTAVGLLANSGQGDSLTRTGFAVLTEMVHAASSHEFR